MNTAAAVLVLFLSLRPDTVFVQEPVPVVFTARLRGGTAHPPKEVRLMRLEAAGNESVSCVFKEDASRVGEPKNDRLYTCSLTLKEKTQGMLSYTAEADYPDRSVPLRSRPAFISIVGGISPKERRMMLKLQTDGNQLYETLTKEKGLEQARKETVVWLLKQPGVLHVRSMLNADLSVQFASGATLWVKPPKGAKRP